MNDLISRQAALDGKISIQLANGVEIYSDEAVLVEYLKNLPSVQPEPHEGYWIEGGIYRDVIECYCSECGQLMTTAATVRMNFCPNCGAKMTISK